MDLQCLISRNVKGIHPYYMYGSAISRNGTVRAFTTIWPAISRNDRPFSAVHVNVWTFLSKCRILLSSRLLEQAPFWANHRYTHQRFLILQSNKKKNNQSTSKSPDAATPA